MFCWLYLKHVYRFILTFHDHNAIAGYQATSTGSMMQLVWIHQWSRPTQLHMQGPRAVSLVSFSLRSQTYQSSCIVLERLHWTETAQPSLLFLGNHMTGLVGFVLGCGRDLAWSANFGTRSRKKERAMVLISSVPARASKPLVLPVPIFCRT